MGSPLYCTFKSKRNCVSSNAFDSKGKPILKGGLESLLKVAPDKTLFDRLMDKIDKTVTGVESRRSQSDYYKKKIENYINEAYYRNAIESLKRR